jgi:cytochrome o ubiquinol oxidase subunit 2
MTADDAPMSSFWIPNIGGQLYAMTGHSNRLNLLADKLGNYPGYTAEINGAGFADMKFTANVSSRADFDLWVQSIQQHPAVLNTAVYNNMLKPSEANPPAFYGSYKTNLYDTVMMKYMGSHGMHETSNSHEGHE